MSKIVSQACFTVTVLDDGSIFYRSYGPKDPGDTGEAEEHVDSVLKMVKAVVESGPIPETTIDSSDGGN